MKDDKKKTEATEVEEEVVVVEEEKLRDEDLDKASGGSDHADGPIYDWDDGIVGKDGRVYPRLIWPDENKN